MNRMVPDGMRQRLLIAKNLHAFSGGWPQSFLKMGVDVMRQTPQDNWGQVQQEFDEMAEGLWPAVLCEIAKEVVEEAEESGSGNYPNVVELMMRYIKAQTNERLGRVHDSEMWIARRSMDQFQEFPSDPTWEEAGMLVEAGMQMEGNVLEFRSSEGGEHFRALYQEVAFQKATIIPLVARENVIILVN